MNTLGVIRGYFFLLPSFPYPFIKVYLYKYVISPKSP